MSASRHFAEVGPKSEQKRKEQKRERSYFFQYRKKRKRKRKMREVVLFSTYLQDKQEKDGLKKN